MKDNTRIDDILNECLDRLLAGHETVEQCLQAHPQHAAKLEPLLRTAVAMDHAVRIDPGAEMKARIRYQLQLQMAEADRPRWNLRWNWQPRWAMAAMAVMLVFVMGGGTVLAADSSMPGNPLYPVKIATENVRVSLAGTETEKAELLATIADRRVEEMDHVTAKSGANARQVDKLAERYIHTIDRIGSLHVVTGNGEVAVTQPALSTASAPQTAAIAPAEAPTLTAPAPEGETPPLKATAPPTTAQTRPGQKEGEASQDARITSQPARESGDSREDKKDASLSEGQLERLKKLVAYYGKAHPEQLEKLLEDERIPEQYKPAIRRMAQEARQNYQDALRNLERRQAQDKDKHDD